MQAGKGRATVVWALFRKDRFLVRQARRLPNKEQAGRPTLGVLLERAVRRRRTFQAPHYGPLLRTQVFLGSALWIATTQAVIHFPPYVL